MHRVRVLGPASGVRIRYRHAPDRFYPLIEYNPLTIDQKGYQGVDVIHGWFARPQGAEEWLFAPTHQELQTRVSALFD